MTDVATGRMSGARAAATTRGGFVEWGSVIAGALIATALSFVLVTFGSAIGLSFVSPWSSTSASAKVIASLAVFWFLAQQIASFMIGGYVAGRMRAGWSDAAADEVEFRDGLHGGLVWAIGIVLGAVLFVTTVGAIAKGGAELAGRAMTSATSAVASSNSDPLAYQVDSLLRTTSQARQGAPGAQAPAASAEQRAELTRIFARSIANGSLNDSDRTYLAGVVAQRTGLSQADAEKRVNEVYSAASTAAKDAADKARRAAILTGLVTALSWLVALGAAWWAAQKGGHHRDNAIPARFALPTYGRPVA